MANKTITFGADLNPNEDLTYNLGTSSAKWNIYGTLTGNASTATKWASTQKVYVTLGTASTTTTIQGGSSSAQTIGVDGTLNIGNGGTGATSALAAANNLTVPYIGNAGTAMTSGSNIDTNYNTPGTYYTVNNAGTQSLLGVKPSAGSGIKIITVGGYRADTLYQFAGNSGNQLMYRNSQNAGTTWSQWYKFVRIGSSESTVNGNSGTVASFSQVGGSTQPVYVSSAGEIVAGTALKALAYKDSLIAADIPDISDTYLPLSGGTMTGQINHAGVGSNWKGGRTNARLCMTAPIEDNTENWGTWTPYISMRTVDGSWDLGAHKVSNTNANDLTFNFLTNTVANGTNAIGPQVHFRPDITNNKVTIIADTFSGNATTATTATSASALTATKQNSANLNDDAFKTQNLKIWYASGSNTITNYPTGFTSAEGAGWFTYRVADNYYGQLFHSHTNHLYIRTIGSSNTDWAELSTKKYVDDQISAGFAANDAMVYKGVLNKDATETATSLKNVPKSGYSAGWTYKVAVAGTYANVSCEVGDMVIAVTDAAANQSTVNNAHWTVVQSNLVGAVVATSGESGYIAKFSGAYTITKGPKIGTSTTTWLNEKGEWSTPTAANVGAATSGHTHGNITNGGGMTATGAALADGDTLLFVDSSETNKLIKQTSITFDGSTTTSALSKKGTWESTVTVSVAANDTSSTGTFPVMYAATNTSTATAKNDTLKKSTGKLYFQPSTGTLTATKFSGDLSGTATNATNIRVSLNTNTKLYLLGTTSAPIDALIGVNLSACEDTGVYVTSTAGALSAVQHSYNVSGIEKAYTTYNTTDDSIDFIFI